MLKNVVPPFENSLNTDQLASDVVPDQDSYCNETILIMKLHHSSTGQVYRVVCIYMSLS